MGFWDYSRGPCGTIIGIHSLLRNMGLRGPTDLLLMIEILHHLKALTYGNYGIILILGHAGFISSTAGCSDSGFRDTRATDRRKRWQHLPHPEALKSRVSV